MKPPTSAKLRPALLLWVPLWLWNCQVGRAQQEDPTPPPIPPGYVLVEGDILVRAIAPAAPYQPEPGNYWPQGVVPFRMHSNVSVANSNAMRLAMNEWEAVANVHFIPRTSQSDYLLIQSNSMNSSAVGREGGPQVVNIFNWNFRFIMVHELAHALGFWHEQSRSDRDQYVRIETDNIIPDALHNFDKHDEANHYGPYDFDSLMHYDQCAFLNPNVCPACTINCRSITVLPPNDVVWQNRIGQITHLSEWDVRIMSFLYPWDDWRFVDRNFTGSPESGTFLKPYKTFAAGKTGVPNGGTIWIQPGTYSAVGTHAKAMTLRAPLSGVTLR